jgi:1-acyl-sn-glycerol-3-phosphate acyltransferase
MSRSGGGGDDSMEPQDGAAGGRSNVVTLPVSPEMERDELERAERESIEALKEALEDLRGEIRSRLGPSPATASEAAFDWIELFDELRRRASTFGIAERSAVVDDFGMDDNALARFEPLFRFLVDRYWRVDVAGLDALPTDGPCLIVANRSGLMPYDGLVLAHIMERAGHERPRFLLADWLITLPFAQPQLARLGGVRACRENADRLLRTNRSVIAFPEGVKGAAKVFRDRYRLQRFGRGGAVRAAIANGVPLVPVGVVGAEEAHPILFKSHLPARLLGLPFLPVTPTFPLLGPVGALPLPSKWVVRVGKPIELAKESDLDDPLLVSRMTESLRSRIQALVDQGLAARKSVWG